VVSVNCGGVILSRAFFISDSPPPHSTSHCGSNHKEVAKQDDVMIVLYSIIYFTFVSLYQEVLLWNR